MDTVYYDKDLCVFIVHAEQETPFNVGYDSLEFYCLVSKHVSYQP